MKKIFTCCLIWVLSLTSIYGLTYNGSLTLTTQSEVNAFNYDVVTGGLRIDGSGITNINALSTLDTAGSVVIANTAITNVSGLSNLKYLSSVSGHSILQFDNNISLNNLTGLGNTTFTVDMSIIFNDCDALINFQGIQNLNFNSPVTKVFNVSNCDGLTSLSGLVVPTVFPDGLINELRLINNSNLTDVSALAGFSTAILEINNNDNLAAINFASVSANRKQMNVSILNNDKLKRIQFLPNSASTFSITNNLILDSISGFDQTDFAWSDLNSITITNNPKLKYIHIFNFTGFIPTMVTQSITITNNTLLPDLNFLNKITKVSGNLTVTNNAALTNCCGIYNLCNSGVSGTITISGNPSECSSKSEIISTCANPSTSNIIYGRIYSDVNSNNKPDAADIFLDNIKVRSTKGGNTLTHISSDTGKYIFATDTGAYTVQPVSGFANFATLPVSQAITHATYGNSDTVNFKLSPTAFVNDASIVLTNNWRTRPNRQGTYALSYTNESGQSYTGTIKMKLDSRLSYQSATPAPTSIVGDTMIWSVVNLSLFTTKYISVNFQASASLVANDTINSFVKIYNGTADVTPGNNQSYLMDIVRAPYDPNNKEVDRTILSPAEVAQGPYLYYTIHFQNVGNDTAQNVVIKDTLDANLDWTTFQPIAVSHKYNLDETNNRYLTFDFRNINLPDSTQNEKASHGFITFKIKPKTTLVIGNSILNRASIVFDINAPVVTNYAKTVIMQTNAGADQLICAGESITLSATGASSYMWNTGQPTATITVSPANTTNYVVTGTVNGISQSDTITVNVKPLPTISLGSDVSICNGSSTTLTAATNAGSVSWSSGQSGPTVTVSPISSTTYIATGTLNGCIKSDTITVNVKALPTISLGSDVSICNGSSTTLTAATNAGSVSWSSGQSGPTVTVSPISSTTYIATGTLNGCTKSDTITVNVKPLPTISLGSDVSICNGSSTTLTAATNAGSVSWSSGQSGPTVTVSPSTMTNYIARGTLNGCTRSDTISVTVKSLPDASFSKIINGASVEFTALGAGSYIWHFGDSDSSSLGNPIHIYSQSGVFYISLIVTQNGCSNQHLDSVVIILTSIKNSISLLDNLEIFPNPAKDYIAVNIHAIKPSDIKIMLMSIDGKVLISKDFKSSSFMLDRFNLSQFSPGVYFLNIQVGYESATYKILKR